MTEANTNPRYHNPPGTDPRIRSRFGAAWYASALCQFALGGGDALCFFTLDGGFGACQLYKSGLVLYPVYHAIGLLRLAAGDFIVPLASAAPEVEGYWFSGGGRNSLVVINKSAGPREVELGGLPGEPCREYVLNEAGAAACGGLTPDGEIPSLPAREGVAPALFRMDGYEVRVRVWNR
ncbi:hypothetical protein SDC9_201244 [bioreactor metagenome]|uniref:D-apionate lactonase TIM barrel domain-containing protein n=1 Tax=bioreactor metagenome TaxID=1076179 RepID=A0A645IRL0_9ZZZZ